METLTGEDAAPSIPPGSLTDLRQRPKKKSKGADGSSEIAEKPEKFMSPDKRKASYKSRLIGDLDTEMGTTPFEEAEEYPLEEDFGFDTDEDADEEEDPLCPNIYLTKAEKQALSQPRSNSLAVKVLGKRVGFHF